MKLALRTAAAAVSGAVAATAFEPFALSWLVLLGVAGLTLAARGLRGRRALLVGLAYGAGFMGVLVPWLQVIGVDAWIGLTILEASFYALLGLGLARVQRLPGWPLWAAATWVAVDALRSTVPWGGFPWGRLGFATVDTPLDVTLSWWGVAGTSFVVGLLGSLVAWLVVEVAADRRLMPTGGVVVTAAALVAVPAVVGRASLPDSGTVRVAAVQGNVPGEGMDAFSERRAVLDNHVSATEALAARVDAGEAPRPAMVLWPENSTDIDPFEDRSVYDDIQRAVDAVDVPTLVGGMVGGPGPRDVENQGIVWLPGSGPAAAYAKTHPVPFGEYIPMRDQLAKLFERLDQIPRDMVPGTRPGLLDMGGTTIGDVICFEIAYDDSVRSVAGGDGGEGAGMMVVQTNNATYMGTGQVEQQFAIARLRAVETGRSVVVVATNGVSGVIAPDGSVLQRAPVRETAVLEADVTQHLGATPGVRWGGLVQHGLVALAVLGQALAFVVGRRRRREEPTTASRPAPEAVTA